jgi:hypothetical protein
VSSSRELWFKGLGAPERIILCHIRVALFTHGLLFNLVEISMHKKALASLYGFSLTRLRLSVFKLQMEVGIEDCLHIEFEYSKSK